MLFQLFSCFWIKNQHFTVLYQLLMLLRGLQVGPAISWSQENQLLKAKKQQNLRKTNFWESKSNRTLGKPTCLMCLTQKPTFYCAFSTFLMFLNQKPTFYCAFSTFSCFCIKNQHFTVLSQLLMLLRGLQVGPAISWFSEP